jgi:hypothetical protein
MGRLGNVEGKGNRKGRTFTKGALHFDFSAQKIDKFLDDVEPNSRSAIGSSTGTIELRNIWKIAGSISYGIPIPVSLTSNSMTSEKYRTEIVTLPFSVNLMALLIRF